MEEIIYSQNNNSTIFCYSMDFSGISKQNAHGGWNVLPKMFVGRWWHFLEKCWKTGWSEQDVQGIRMLPWMATGAVPVRIRTATHFSLENSHRETSHRGRTFRSPWTFVEFTATLRYEPYKVKTETAIWELAHKSRFLFLPWCGECRDMK